MPKMPMRTKLRDASKDESDIDNTSKIDDLIMKNRQQRDCESDKMRVAGRNI
ncbi:hypothetical protein SOASR014_33900 [Pectobacterium carotovorum subsp. carotovorum]|nr:hypothetical protein SOASR014_33900 [Pectobacterium carotovorum subsp. carotovorum]GLX45855.1 hypothetical protein Pcaca01_35230 [Pectobacterium carotovorum subsp. carotovorum]